MWPGIINTLGGFWICIMPAVFEINKRTADAHHILGTLIMATAIISISESVRNFRYVNILPAVCLLILSFIYDTGSDILIWNNVVIALIVISASLIKGKVKNKFGGGWRSLFQRNPPHLLTEDRE